MTKNSRISVLLPCMNEEENISLIYEKIISQLPDIYEIIFIDDGSTDNTLNEIKKISELSSVVKYISFSRNFGHQYALKAGFDFASGDAVITLDADLQHPPELMSEMIIKWKEGYDIVQTIRNDTENTNWLKRLTSSFFYKLINKLSDIKIEPGAADFRLINRKVINALNDFPEYYLFYRGLFPYMGFKQYNMPYVPAMRHAGKTKYDFRKMLRFALYGITSFSTKPLRLAIYLGLVFSGLAILYAIYALGIYFFTSKAVSGWASMIVTLVFFGGIQICLIGIVGEYLGKLFIENKRRPKYIVAESKL